MYLLDTNVLSELRKLGDGRADANVAAWVGAVPAAECHVSALSLMELEIGILRVERRDPAQGAALRRWMQDRVLPEFAPRCLAVDAAVALRCAGLHVPDPKSERDALIAATALVHGLRVVTRNIADFAATGVPLLDPWQG
ncbi:type II toxin-antitoxin system VapC family toxin [Mangrovicoccus algicola]|uniref:Ribonuclease VapC n=1 Tax=Mangrovicoccus algicola TaxID=2771008 RepID=A0A8J6YWF3_9RHOB|nr:type II toxin-antitoxin system VapC family toxin [Mangrovicoccus algicola]MBE3640443.1 type II toxin-antitoxin system VapC family toxin [Mangrovicoccus algicola]